MEAGQVYQHTRLYELSVSTKLLLTGFILAICTAGALGVAGFYHAHKDADGIPAISFKDVKISVSGAHRAVLERAADKPDDWGLGGTSTQDRETLKAWCRDGARRATFPEIKRILKDSYFDRDPGQESASEEQSLKNENEEYERIAALARPRHPLSSAELAAGITLYLAIMSLALLGLGVLFVRTSLFEKTKVFFVGATFVFAAACPVCLWLGRTGSSFLYLMLLSGLLLAVCFVVFALVTLYDLWLRRPVT